MHFLINTSNKTVVAYKGRGDAARAALSELGITVKPGADPVKQAHDEMGSNTAILNLSAAFEFISESDDAQSLALKFKQAVDDFFTL